MMKKITLLMSLTFLCVGFLKSQVLLEAVLTDGDLPVTWLNLDVDAIPGDVFFTDQGLWATSEWTPVNFGAPGVAFYSTGEFATVPTTASDWLITDQVTLGSSSNLSLDLIAFAAGCTFQIRVATALAGMSPVPSDFSNLVTPSLSLTGSQAWVTYNFNLAAFAGQAVYFAFVNTTADLAAANAVKLTGIRNIRVFQPLNNDLEAIGITLGSVDVEITDYLVNNLSYASYACLGDAAETLIIEILNNGVNPIDSFNFGFQVDNNAPVIEFVVPSTPVASGASYSHTFTGTADFLTSGDPLYSLSAWATILNEADFENDTAFVDFVITPQSHDFNVAGAYFDNFDRIDFGSGQLQNFENSWAWTLIDANMDGFTTRITIDLPGTSTALSGDYALTCGWNPNGTTPSNDYAFAPCMDMEAGVGYKVSVQAACGEDAGGIYPEAFRFVRNTVASNVGATILSDNDVTEPTYNEFSSSFVVPADGSYHLGIQVNSPADAFYLNLDDFIVEKFDNAPVAALSVSGQDEFTGGVFIDYCDSTISVSNTSTGIFDAATINWGDGTTGTFTGGLLTHKYAAFGSYTVTVSVSNVLGSNSATATVNITATPAPVVTFGAPLITGLNVTVSLGSSPGTNVVYTPSCSRVIIDWGDGVIDEVTGTSASSHTYTPGTYTITVTVLGNPSATATREVVIAGPNSINDVNFAGALSIFPNPVNDLLNVSFELNINSNIDLSIYGVDGKIVNTRVFNNAKEVNTTFNTSSLNNGVYILKVQTDNGTSTQKFVVSHN
jgi:hypothetical protein